MSVELRTIPDPAGIATAVTLPAAWYSETAHFERERRAVFAREWMCVGVANEMPAPGAWRAISSSGTPLLLVRDRDGALRCFLNVCRHRAAPLCEQGEGSSGSLLRCPYHSWLYRLDGSLAKANGVGNPEGFDPSNHSLTEVGLSTWRHMVFVRIDGSLDGDVASSLDLGPLAAAIDAFPIENFELCVSESHERPFNWKVLLENYSENYHTPFIHPEIDTSSSEDYPMVSDGRLLYAWDRKVRPGDKEAEQIMSTLLPGEPGWERLATAPSPGPYGVGSYLTAWPNLMLNVFPDACLVMWMDPISPNVTRVERRLYLASATTPDQRAASASTHHLVHQQDVDICTSVQRSHDAGLNANGVLATVEERGVFFVHQHLRAALSEYLAG